MTFISDLRGIWTYRSFANAAGPVDDFNKLKVWEAELYIEIEEDGRLHGHLWERPETATGSEPYLVVSGQFTPGQPSVLSWRAKGRPNTETADWIYDYVGTVAPAWPDAPRQRTAITGTVTRTLAHGTAPAGSVFSFVAVKSDFVEPRTRIPLAKPVLDLMGSAEHRYHHALWHASRDEWAQMSDAKKEALRAIGWQPGPNGAERPSLSADRLTNGSGEDFLFMHRRMVRDIRALDPGVTTWRSVPRPRPLADFAAGTSSANIGNPDGYALAPPWTVPGDPGTTTWLVELRKSETLYSRFQAWEAQYTDPRYLASISLGELGSRVEFTIHNWMHMRWASVTRDPSPDKSRRGLPIPGGREPLDFDPKWLDPEYDYLGETFSSHVNPVFWRLHGWVDDRIEDWFRAQEATRPGAVKRRQIDGLDWFEADGTWVRHEVPWEGAADSGEHGHAGDPHAGHAHGGGHGGHGGLVLDVPTMQNALKIIFGPEPGPAVMSLDRETAVGRPQGTWFRLL